MTHVQTLLTAALVVLLSAGPAPAQPPNEAAAKQQANAELDSLAQALASLSKVPGFRGFLRSEIAKSKNQESIIELDRFLDRASKRQGMPPGLAKVRDSAVKAKGRLKAAKLSELEGHDLYIPVDAHRKKWKGGEDFVVAFAPVGNEDQVKEIVGYSVSDGKRVTFDPKKAPETVVLIVAPEEHQTHEVTAAPAKQEPGPPENPKPDFTEPHVPLAPGEDETGGGNSYVGLKWLKIFNDLEPWYLGYPEIYVQIFQKRGTSYGASPRCTRLLSWSNYVDRVDVWYNTWSYHRYASPLLRHYFDRYYGAKVLIEIKEYDGGYDYPRHFNLDKYVKCTSWGRSNDDWVGTASNYKSYIPYDGVKFHRLRQAYLGWTKMH